jgi:hypothetical protein
MDYTGADIFLSRSKTILSVFICAYRVAQGRASEARARMRKSAGAKRVVDTFLRSINPRKHRVKIGFAFPPVRA